MKVNKKYNVYSIQEALNDLNKIEDDDLLQSTITELVDTYRASDFSYNASMYILPDGTLLNLGDSGNGHSDVSKYLNSLGLEKNYEAGKASKLLYSLGWIRVNNRWKFITLSDKAPTAEQYKQLLGLFDFYKSDYQVTTMDGQTKTYRDRTSDEVVKLIKRYYSSGVLYENTEG